MRAYREAAHPEELGRFENQFLEMFVLYRKSGEVYITGDEYDWEEHRFVTRLGSNFSHPEEECAEIDLIVPTQWELEVLYDPEQFDEAGVPLEFVRRTNNPGCDIFLPHEKLKPLNAIPWEVSEQSVYLEQYGDEISPEQYAVMRGYAPGREAKLFLKSYLAHAGCCYRTHIVREGSDKELDQCLAICGGGVGDRSTMTGFMEHVALLQQEADDRLRRHVVLRRAGLL